MEKQKKNFRENTHQTNHSQEKDARVKDSVGITLDWLRETFPKTFIKKKVYPLKLGILEDIFEKLPQDKSISKKMMRRTMMKYTRSNHYHEEMLIHANRLDLRGEATSKITEAHKDNAKRQLALSLLWHIKQKKER